MDDSQITVVAVKLSISVVQNILKRSLSLLTDEILNSWNLFQLELNQIHGSLTVILSLLKDAEDSPLSDQTKPFSVWLDKLTNVAHEAEDVLDDLAYQNLKQKVPDSKPIFKSIDFLKKDSFNFKLAQKVKTLNESLREIRREARSFRFDVQFRSRDGNMIHIDLDRVTKRGIEDTVVGNESDVSELVSLLSSASQRVLTIIPIVGFDGLGKTTLAKLASEQVMARKFFDVEIWLDCFPTSLSDGDFNIVLRRMLRALNGIPESFVGTNPTVQQLKKKLERKRFLLVLDSFYMSDFRWWRKLETCLLKVSSRNGNAVLVTSSDVQGAPYARLLSLYMLKKRILSKDECWLIMKERAFGNGKPEISDSLENIGREIAEYCGGVPLVAKVLGGTMGFDVDEEAWLRIKDEIALLKNRLSDNLLLVLLLSFNRLPSDLKLALAFCSDLPKGYPIKKEEVIHLWMVEGFIDSYDQGNTYFSALLENSFFHDVETSDDGDVVHCKVPDNLSYFASILVKPVIKNWTIPPHINLFPRRHMYVDYEHLRFSFPSLAKFFQEFSWELKRLRTLHFRGDDMNELPSSVGKLRHLRYLSASGTKVRSLPNSITKLYHLQALNISNTCIKVLPKSIFELQSLQCLNVSNSHLVNLPEAITKLHRLQNLNASSTNIKELPKSIGKLQNLETLNVSNSRIKELPESMTALQNLKSLNVSNSNLLEFPEVITKLENLKTLNVSNSRIVELPEFITKLENLQTLNVSNCNIKEFPESITNLRKLQTLKFLECRELSKFPRKNINNMINLKNISFSYEHQMPFGLGNLTSFQTLPFFVVGPNFGGSIGELEFLNELSGQLEITRLEEVQDKEEAGRANLIEKTKIQGLGFQWSNGAICRISRDEELLECLQPNPNIRRVKIKYYMGKRWPSWMFKKKFGFHSFAPINTLVELELEHCWNSVQLPQLGNLPGLKSLRISHMGGVKLIDDDFYGISHIAGSSSKRLRVFPSLKSLSLSWMESLTEWISPLNSRTVVVFPCLELLSIQSCAKLANFPFADLSALVKMEIKDCENLRLIIHKQQQFSHLNYLSIVGCPKLTELRDWLRPKLTFMDLSVRKCQWLTFIPMELGKLSSLTSLDVSCCNRLNNFSEEILCRFSQLKHLSIGAFSKELDDSRYLNRINDLQWLEELEIWGSDIFRREMSILPGQIQGLTGLKSLKIMGFTTMEVLPEWLVNLQSLESLSLNHCRNLGCQSVTAIIQLPSLADLYIRNCPVLEESGSEWLLSLNTKNIKVEFSNVRASNH